MACKQMNKDLGGRLQPQQLRGEGRVQLRVQLWAGIRVCRCGQALRNVMCLEGAMHSSAALQCNCKLSSKRNITLEDINYSRFSFFIFIGVYLFTNSGYTADWRELSFTGLLFNLNNFLQGSSCNAEMSGWDTWAKAISLALPLHCSTWLKLFCWKTR